MKKNVLQYLRGSQPYLLATAPPSVDLTADSIIAIFKRLGCFAAEIALLLMLGAIVWYSIQYATSKGDQTKVSAARESLKWAGVGMLVILGAYTIIATIANAVGADISLLPISC